MIVKYNQVFNLMDTNGRRNDVINAIQGYISILEEVTVKKKRTWGNLPNSLAQFEFYQKAIEQSPDVFRQHGPYDNLMREIEQYPELKKAIENDEIEKVYLNNVKIVYEDSEEKEDSLIKQSKIGTVARSDEITFTFSRGTSTKNEVKLPDFANMTKLRATAYLEKYKINYEFNDDYSTTVKKGNVIKQSIEKNIEVLYI